MGLGWGTLKQAVSLSTVSATGTTPSPGTHLRVQIVPLERIQKHYPIPVNVGTLGPSGGHPVLQPLEWLAPFLPIVTVLSLVALPAFLLPEAPMAT